MWTEQELDEYERAHRIDPDDGCNIMGCDAGEGVPPCRVADLVAEVRRLRAGLEYIAEPGNCDGPYRLSCWHVADNILAGKALPD